VLVAHHLQKFGAHLVTALARLRVHKPERRNSLEAGNTRDKKRRGGAKKRKKLPVAVWRGKQRMPVARARVYPKRENEGLFCLLTTEAITKKKRKRGACGEWAHQ
jgi:hypothetical protein